MLNLLPHNEMNVVRREYLLRFSSVASVLAGVIIICATVAMFPSYTLVETKNSIVTAQLQSIRSSSVAKNKDDVEKMLADVKTKTTVSKTLSSYDPSYVVQRIIDTIPKAVIVNGLQYDRGDKGAHKVVVSGVASSRNGLISFVQGLSKAGFKVSDVPVSDLASDSNIPFSLSVIAEEK